MLPPIASTAWRKSSYSGNGSGGGDCVEVAAVPGVAGVRDSKQPSRVLALRPEAWAAFVGAVRSGDVTV
ncbi:DUF397 domain-containing protein [Streptomyces sp. NPDC005438]|uniref:DUF397 domain-containing protein n=1 Tax=Streptomyces sp. NPDC005438 TaxID=3156880 RepID=UPI0033A60401